MDLYRVVASSGKVHGTVDTDLNVYGSRVCEEINYRRHAMN